MTSIAPQSHRYGPVGMFGSIAQPLAIAIENCLAFLRLRRLPKRRGPD
jgi:hypothetical protein